MVLGSLSGNAPHTEGHQCCLVQGWIIDYRACIYLYRNVSTKRSTPASCQWELSVILMIVSGTARAAYSDHVVCKVTCVDCCFYPHICWAICSLPVFVLYAVIIFHVDLQIDAFSRTSIHHAWLSRDAFVILTWIQMKKKRTKCQQYERKHKLSALQNLIHKSD